MLNTAYAGIERARRPDGTYPGGHRCHRLALLQSLALYCNEEDLSEILDEAAASMLHGNEGQFNEREALDLRLSLVERRDVDPDAWRGTDRRRTYNDIITGLRGITTLPAKETK